MPEETAWLLDLADAHPFIKGVVGWVDLRSAVLGRQLEQFACHPALRGVRHVLHDEPDGLFMLRKDLLTGISLLGESGLVCGLRE
jgi:L-fuconolactonase